MSRKCLGCGAILQSESVNKEGFVKLTLLDKAEYCERCFKIKNYGEYSVLDKKIDFDGILRNINSDQNASVVFLIDVLSISNKIRKYISKFRVNKYILISKIDVLPKSVKDKKIISYFRKNVYDTDNILCISSKKNYNIDEFLSIVKKDDVRRLYIVGFTNCGKSTFINRVLGNFCKKPVITTSSVPNTTASYITIKLDSKLTIVDTPGFIDSNAIYNFIDYDKVINLYPKKEIKVKVFQVKTNYSIVVDNILRIDNLGDKNSFSFYMNDKLKYEKIMTKNEKLNILPNISVEIDGETDILINGLGFIKVTKKGMIKIYTLDTKLISKERG